MRHLVLAALLWAVQSPTAAAPIPRHIAPPKPTKLTPELLAGCWKYEWSSSLNGSITFDDKGNYIAQHDPMSTTTYSGTYSVDGGSITLVEWSHHITTGSISGPSTYRFDLDVKGWPVLDGKSTGSIPWNIQVIPQATIHLKLSERK